MCRTLHSLVYLFLIWRRFLPGNRLAMSVKSEPKVDSACGQSFVVSVTDFAW